jgi:hypothetical protein
MFSGKSATIIPLCKWTAVSASWNDPIKIKEVKMKKGPAKISSKEVKKILAEQQPDKDPSITLGEAVYHLPDGKVLIVVEKGKGLIWNRDELLSLMPPPGSRGKHVLLGLIPDGRSFISSVPELIEQFSKNIGIPLSELNYRWESLKQIDQKVFEEIGRDRFLSSERFPGLLAYIGEYIRRATGPFSKWEARLSSDGEVWEPWIIDPNGNKYNPFMLVYEGLHEDGTPLSFAGSLWRISPT